MLNDKFWMEKAFALALKAQNQGEVPIGAVVVSETNELIGKGWNQVLCLNDPTAHAEILALREAALKINNYRLNRSTLYVTLEPCCMCAGALVHARVQRLVFAARDVKAGACGSCYQLLSGERLNHQIKIDEGLMQTESEALLQHFFKVRRI